MARAGAPVNPVHRHTIAADAILQYHCHMASFTTIDSAGRVVIPKPLRDALRLLPNARLRVAERNRCIVLEPVEEEPILLERDGVVLIGGELVGAAPDTRAVRDERLEELTRRAALRRRA